jgi:hypothetical protein
MSVKDLYPPLCPTLNLDFARAKVLDQRVTFARNSIGTYVGADGLIKTAAANVPRFDHDPVTKESLGLLVEEARTNVALHSGQLGVSWTATNVTRAVDTTTAPDGALTADSILTGTSTVTTSYLFQSVSVGVSTYTFSFYAKGSTSGLSAFIDTYGQGAGASRARGTINLTSGAVTYISQDNDTSILAVNVGNGWWRCQTTVLVFSAGTLEIRIGNALSGEIYVWGAQLEAGAFPTSYIPTTTAAVTRAADVASMTGTNFSSWYNNGAGSFYASWRHGSSAGKNIQTVILGIGTSNNSRFMLDVGSIGSIPQASKGANTWDDFYNGGYLNPSSYRNGVYNSSFFYPTIVGADPTYPIDLKLGYNASTSSRLNGTLARIAYYPVRLPDAQLQALTAT